MFAPYGYFLLFRRNLFVESLVRSLLSRSDHGTSTMIFSFPAFRWTLAGTSFRWRTRRIFFLEDFVATLLSGSVTGRPRYVVIPFRSRNLLTSGARDLVRWPSAWILEGGMGRREILRGAVAASPRNLRFRLPDEFGAELDVAGAAGADYWIGLAYVGSEQHAAHAVDVGQVVVHGEDVEVGVIQNVECFGAQLQAQPFAESESF